MNSQLRKSGLITKGLYVLIKNVFKENESEIVKLDWIKIGMVKPVRHLGNIFDCTFNEQTDCKIKKGQSLGSLNKLISIIMYLFIKVT